MIGGVGLRVPSQRVPPPATVARGSGERVACPSGYGARVMSPSHCAPGPAGTRHTLTSTVLTTSPIRHCARATPLRSPRARPAPGSPHCAGSQSGAGERLQRIGVVPIHYSFDRNPETRTISAAQHAGRRRGQARRCRRPISPTSRFSPSPAQHTLADEGATRRTHQLRPACCHPGNPTEIRKTMTTKTANEIEKSRRAALTDGEPVLILMRRTPET